MNRLHRLNRLTSNGFNFDNDRYFDEKTQPVTTIQFNLSIDHGQRFLLFHLQAALGQFKSQTGFICRLQTCPEPGEGKPGSRTRCTSIAAPIMLSVIWFRLSPSTSALSAFSAVNTYLFIIGIAKLVLRSLAQNKFCYSALALFNLASALSAGPSPDFTGQQARLRTIVSSTSQSRPVPLSGPGNCTGSSRCT